MIAPKPFKFICPKCGYSKTVAPKSDVLNPADFIDTCPKCGSKMERKRADFFDNLKSLFSK
jgi:Zn finger protein HypA/HybF involved in hydrogenase expression